MQVKDIMTENPQCISPEMNLVQVAKLMKECDCGAIPVINDQKNGKPIGIITDRDIVIRAIAEEKDPSQIKVKECMSKEAVTISPEATLEECAKLMEEKQVRRLIVVNGNGKCSGIVVQAQLARNAPKEIAAELLREISQPSTEMAHVKT